MVIGDRYRYLAEIVRATDPAGRFAYLLNGGEQHRDQDADDRDYY